MSAPKTLDLNAAELAQAVRELDAMLAGKRFSRFVEASPRCLLWLGPACDLAIDCTPGFVHACAVSHRRARGEVSPFTMLLRKHIGGTPVARIVQPRPHDRILRVEFVSGLAVSCELTGRHANVFLVDAGGLILGSFFPPHSVTRPLHPGAPYTLPPEPAPDAAGPETSRFPEKAPGAAMEDYFARAMRAQAARQAHQAAITQVRREIARLSRLVERLQADRDRNRAREEGKTKGQLFLQAIDAWPEGARTLQFTPYDAQTPVELTLPEGCRTPAQAAQWHFQQYKKARRGAEIIESRIREFQYQIQLQKEKLQSLLAINPEEFQLPPPISPPSARPKKASSGSSPRKADDSGIRTFTSSDGFPIRVGKSAADNHRLTFQIARGEDLWLHARDVPGAHVVVFGAQKGAVPETTLREAAMLALFYSDARREGRGFVHVAPRKWVRPVPRRTGEVTLSSPRSLFVEIDAAVLQLLQASRPGAQD